ncbi:MAG: beta-ketoacyl-ACP synthase III [Pseudomonadota bacterium]
MNPTNYARILGTGSYLPETVLTNQELEQKIDTTDEWIVQRTGIRSRHIASKTDTTASMGIMAAQRALEAAGCDAASIDLILVATATPDQIFPAVACRIQAALGAHKAAAFDLQAACSGFVYALSVADQFIKTGHYQRILVIGSETLSRITNWHDRGTCILFGDGAGAVVLGASAEPGIIDTQLFADGREGDTLYADNWHNCALEQPYIYMAGNRVFKLAVSALDDLVVGMCKKHHLTDANIDWIVPHQANIRILQATADRLGVSMDKVVCTLAEQGNTSAASIPLALDAAVRDGRIQRGHRLLLESFGGGLTWAAALIIY